MECRTLETEDEETGFLDVDCLQQHGINVADIKKLKAAGICTVKGVQMTTRKKLAAIKGFSEAKVDKIKEACQKLSATNFITALEVSDRRKHVFKISTGSQELEHVLSLSYYICFSLPSLLAFSISILNVFSRIFN